MTEPVLRHGRRGKLLRPFCRQAQVRTRGCSTLLQRVLTDFGAETAFGQVPARVREHYGITVPISTVRACTLVHAQAALVAPPPASAAADLVITEMDGGMVPLLENDPPPDSAPADRRCTKRLFWKEVRLCAAQAAGRVQAYYGASLDSVLEAGLTWEAVAHRAGAHAASRVHGVGDGAPWIAEQFALRFGGQGRYLVDFYHVSEYLAAAAPVCAPATPAEWRRQQQERLRANRWADVLAALLPQLEAEAPGRPARGQAASLTPVRDCWRYVNERREQLDYAGALAAGLPIGSGLIESGHRHVVQARLKRAGTWWLARTARVMIGLRVLRANGDWERYWQSRPLHLNN